MREIPDFARGVWGRARRATVVEPAALAPQLQALADALRPWAPALRFGAMRVEAVPDWRGPSPEAYPLSTVFEALQESLASARPALIDRLDALLASAEPETATFWVDPDGQRTIIACA
jgi:hypothetical protein